jgi:hypothetical protein
MVTNNAANYQPVQYNVLTGGASGGINNISTGTTGQVLIAQGASAQPIWATGGSMVLLSTQTASNTASISFTTQITSTYKNYLLEVTNFLSVSVGVVLGLSLSTNGGTSYLATNYLSGVNYVQYNSSTFANGTITTLMNLYVSTTTAAPTANGVYYLFNLNSAIAPMAMGIAVGAISTGGTLYYSLEPSVQTAATNINALQIKCTSGNMSTGVFSLYGILT